MRAILSITMHPWRPALDKLLQETLAARTIRCDQGIDATPRPLSEVGDAVGRPAA